MHIFECRILTNWCTLHFSCRHRHKNKDMCRTNIKGKRINNKQQTCQPSVLTKKYDNNNQRCRFYGYATTIPEALSIVASKARLEKKRMLYMGHLFKPKLPSCPPGERGQKHQQFLHEFANMDKHGSRMIKDTFQQKTQNLQMLVDETLKRYICTLKVLQASENTLSVLSTSADQKAVEVLRPSETRRSSAAAKNRDLRNDAARCPKEDHEPLRVGEHNNSHPP